MSEDILNKILVKVISMEEQMKNMVTKDDLAEMDSRIMSHIDGLAKRYDDAHQEFAAINNRCDRMDERLTYVEHKVGAVS